MSASRDAESFLAAVRKLVGNWPPAIRHELPAALRRLAAEIELHLATERNGGDAA